MTTLVSLKPSLFVILREQSDQRISLRVNSAKNLQLLGLRSLIRARARNLASGLLRLRLAIATLLIANIKSRR